MALEDLAFGIEKNIQSYTWQLAYNVSHVAPSWYLT